MTNTCRDVGESWSSGYLEAEDECDDVGDFTLDFDDRGMDGNQTDGTDWGRDDGVPKCGGTETTDASVWFIFHRPVKGRSSSHRHS